MKRRPRKSYQNTPNDNPQHIQIRKGSIWFSITSYTQKTRTNTHQRVKISFRTLRDMSNGECSLQDVSTNPIQNAGTQPDKNNYSDHHKYKSKRADEYAYKIRKLIEKEGVKITLLWVPSHVGIPRNEEAAKESLDDNIKKPKSTPRTT
jgi:hypothetical protein